MLYSYSCKFRKNPLTPINEKHILKLANGIINSIEVFFPEGCCGLVHVHLDDGLYQIVPVNSDEMLVGSGNNIKFNEDINFTSEPYELQFYGYNADTSYDHWIDVRIELQKQGSLLRYIMQNLATLAIFRKD